MPAAIDSVVVLDSASSTGPSEASPRIVRVAAAQFAPVEFDLDANVDKVCKLITEAGQKGVQLIAFAECAIPGYPYWIWARSVDMALVEKYIDNALKIDSAQMQRICATAKEAKVAVQLGFSEHYKRTCYIAGALIGADGEIKCTRRKIKPTHMERTIFGDGSGSSLMNVVDVPGVGKVGQLNCWEHTQPLLRYHTYSQGEEIHVAAWPPMHKFDKQRMLYHTADEGAKVLTQTHSIEGGCFSIYVNSVIPQSTVDVQDIKEAALFWRTGGGFSEIFGPDGSRVEPLTMVDEHEEGLVVADLDLSEITRAKHWLDTVGHYSRPDLLWLGVDRREKSHVRPE